MTDPFLLGEWVRGKSGEQKGERGESGERRERREERERREQCAERREGESREEGRRTERTQNREHRTARSREGERTESEETETREIAAGLVGNEIAACHCLSLPFLEFSLPFSAFDSFFAASPLCVCVFRCLSVRQRDHACPGI